MSGPAAPTFSVALYSKQFEVIPYMARGLSWTELVNCIPRHKPYLDKQRDVPMFGPHEIREGQPCSIPTTLAVTFGVLDLDNWSKEIVDWPEDELINLLADLHGAVPYVFASSWSHQGGGKVRGRVLVPFSRPVLPSEWPRFWPILNERYARGRADSKCKDPSRRYWVPAYQEGGTAPPIYERCDDGKPIDVDAIMLDAGVGGFTGGTTPTRDDLRRLADRWASGKKENLHKLAKCMRLVVRGDAFEGPGERDNMLFQLCSEIVSRWPTLDVDEASKLFAPSLAIMGADAPTPEKAADMMRRRQRGMVNSRAIMIREAFGSDRNEPYTPQELEGYSEQLGIPPDRLRQRWVIQRGNSFYVFVNGTYRQYGSEDVVAAAQRDLAPAISAQVDTQISTDKGVRPRTALELVKDFGAVAMSVEVDLSAQSAYYDEERFVMVEAPCPIRVTPKESPEVAKWLELIAGPDKHLRLLQWIAALTFLDQPSAALYLEGPGGAGKTLLACGIAKIWSSERPTTLDEAMGDFNEPLMRCPLVFGDEVAPVDARGRLQTGPLREFIQSHTRPLKRKYQPNATLKGCARLILAANNRNLLMTAEHLNENDINAVVERLFYLAVHLPPGCDPKKPPARVYLESLGQQRVEEWVSKDEIARHALWLRDTIEVPRNTRFLVSGEASDLTRSLATSTGLRSEVCHWLVGFLLTPKIFKQKSDVQHLVRVSRGRLLVNARAVAEYWGDYVQNDRDPPRAMSVSQALTGISTGRVFLRHKTEKVAYREIDLENLREWAITTQYADVETLVRALVALDDESADEVAA